jgi:hypothetical protein
MRDPDGEEALMWTNGLVMKNGLAGLLECAPARWFWQFIINQSQNWLGQLQEARALAIARGLDIIHPRQKLRFLYIRSIELRFLPELSMVARL